jgi:hypothetical protein
VPDERRFHAVRIRQRALVGVIHWPSSHSTRSIEAANQIQPTLCGSLNKPNLHDEFRLHPLHLTHLISGHAATPA